MNTADHNRIIDCEKRLMDAFLQRDMSSITTSDLLMHFIGDNAVVSMNVEFSGHYYDNVINARYRYIRVWKLFYGHWKVISVGGIPIT